MFGLLMDNWIRTMPTLLSVTTDLVRLANNGSFEKPNSFLTRVLY